LDGPVEDAGPFGLELLDEMDVAVLRWDRDGERNQVEPAADCFVDASERGFVVASDQQLELRFELEEVLSHVAGDDLIAAGELLYLAFGPAAAMLDFPGR
jgi:hypothetical protein